MNQHEIKTRIPALSNHDAAVIARVINRHDAIKKLTGCNDAIAAELCKAAASESLADALANRPQS